MKGLFMKIKRIFFNNGFIIFLYLATSTTFAEARDSKGLEFEEMYAVVGVVSVEKSVEHSVTLGNARSGLLRKQTLVGPVQLGVSVRNDNCLVGYEIASPDETTERYRIKVWITKESKPIELVVGPVEIAFLPGKILQDGPPVGDESQVVYEVREVFEEFGVASSMVKKICLPVEYRHHFERKVPPSRANPYVYIEKKNDDYAESNKSIVDDFGVHSLSCRTSTQVIQIISRYKFVE